MTRLATRRVDRDSHESVPVHRARTPIPKTGNVLLSRPDISTPAPEGSLSEDPISRHWRADFYSYVANNPMGFRDALGLCNLPIRWGRDELMSSNWLRAQEIPAPTGFNKGQGSAPDIMSKVRILLGDPTPGPRSPDADTFPDSTSPDYRVL